MQSWIGIRERIDHILPTLRPAERAVARFIHDHTEKAASLTVGQLADIANVSQPTVIRFSRKLGFDGYRELRYVLLHPEAEHEVTVNPLEGFDLQPWHDTRSVIATSIERDKTILDELAAALDPESLRKATDLITSAAIIDIYGSEDSLAAAFDLFTKLGYLGLTCRLNEDVRLRTIGAAHLDQSAAVIAVAPGNGARAMAKTLRLAHTQGARTIAISRSPGGALDGWADVSLFWARDDQQSRGNAVFSHVVQTALIDILYMGIILSDYGRFSTELDRSGKILSSRDTTEYE